MCGNAPASGPYASIVYKHAIDMRLASYRSGCSCSVPDADSDTAASPTAATGDGHSFPRQDHNMNTSTPATSVSSPNKITFTSVVANTKIQPASATRLGSG